MQFSPKQTSHIRKLYTSPNQQRSARGLTSFYHILLQQQKILPIVHCLIWQVQKIGSVIVFLLEFKAI